MNCPTTGSTKDTNVNNDTFPIDAGPDSDFEFLDPRYSLFGPTPGGAGPASFDVAAVRTDARSQFVSLGAGVIVGRCGGSSHVRYLTPQLLSHMGREWIVFPSHNHVVSLESRAYDSPYADDVDDGEGEELSLGGFDGLCKKSCCSEVNLMFSISPTLGLVSLPVAVDFGGLLFMEWVGPRPDRFALATTRPVDDSFSLCVMDIRTKAVVKLAERLGLATPWCCSRRWAAAVPEDSQEFGMTLWNFDRIEAEMAASVAGGDGACGIAKVGGIALPGGDISMAIGESSTLECDSMLLRSGHVDGLMLTVDMPATLAQRKMVARESTLPIIKHMWRQMFWEGKAYATLKDRTLVCLTTGKQTDLGIDAFLQHIGGPLYVLKRDCYPKVWEVYSLKDPGKLLYKHAVARHGTSAVGKGLLVEEPGEYSDPNLIKVIDAASGTVIFTITNKCKYYVSTVS